MYDAIEYIVSYTKKLLRLCVFTESELPSNKENTKFLLVNKLHNIKIYQNKKTFCLPI